MKLVYCVYPYSVYGNTMHDGVIYPTVEKAAAAMLAIFQAWKDGEGQRCGSNEWLEHDDFPGQLANDLGPSGMVYSGLACMPLKFADQ